MAADTPAPHRPTWLVISALLVLAAVVGLASPYNRSTSGMVSGPTGEVTRLTAGGPAERAGIQVGDRIATIDGVAVGDRIARLRQGPAAIGSSRVYRFAHDGETIEVAVTHGPITPSTLALFIAATGVGLLFLVCGVGTYLARPTGVTRIAAVLGLCALPGFSPIPYIPSEGARMALTVVLFTIGSLLTPLLLHLTLRFPDGPQCSRGLRRVIYAPAGLVAVLGFITLFLTPVTLPVLLALAGGVPALTVLLTLVIAVVRWRRADDPAKRLALALLTLALAVGLIPLFVGLLASSLPGASGYFLTIAAIPLGIALGFRGTRPQRLEAVPAV